MINFRQTDLPIEYEPVIVDFHDTVIEVGYAPTTARINGDRFTEVMAKVGYRVYASSVISDSHIQIVYLRLDMYEKAREDFLRSDCNSAGFLRVTPK